MTRRTSRLVLLFVSLLAGLCQTPSARAETPAETAAAFGLLGTWAVDCRLPPSLGNGYLTYAAAPGGNIAHDRDFGSQRNVGEVVRASLTAGGIDLVVFFPVSAQSRQITIAKAADGRCARSPTVSLMPTSMPSATAGSLPPGRRCPGRCGAANAGAP